jgi:acyl carrier protein
MLIQETTVTEAIIGDPTKVFEQISEQLAPFNKNGIELTEATDINADLNIDSVAILDLLMTIEDAYEISIPINLLADVRTVGDLTDIVKRMIEAQG